MPNDSMHGPHISCAFLCEKVLQERDGVASFIRVVDRFFIPGQTPQMPPAPVQAMIVVGLKAGRNVHGRHKIVLRVHKPDESVVAEMEQHIFFEGGEDHGVLVGSPMVLIVDEEGVYWIDVLFIEKLMTRIPMRVMYQRGPVVVQPPQG